MSELGDRRLLCNLTCAGKGGALSDTAIYLGILHIFSVAEGLKFADLLYTGSDNNRNRIAKVLSFRAKPRQLGGWTTGGGDQGSVLGRIKKVYFSQQRPGQL